MEKGTKRHLLVIALLLGTNMIIIYRYRDIAMLKKKG